MVRIVSLRRTEATGAVAVLSRRHEVDRQVVHRLVLAEVDWGGGLILFARLRRREPGDQPKMKEVVQRQAEAILRVRGHRWWSVGFILNGAHVSNE